MGRKFTPPALLQLTPLTQAGRCRAAYDHRCFMITNLCRSGLAWPAGISADGSITRHWPYELELYPAIQLVPIYQPRRDDRLGWPGAWVGAYSFAPRL